MSDYTLFHRPGNGYAAGLFAGLKDQELNSGWAKEFREVGYLSVPSESFISFPLKGKGIPITAVGPQFNSRDIELESQIENCLRERFGEGAVAVDDLFVGTDSSRPVNNFYAFLVENLDLYGAYVDGIVKEILAVRKGVTDPSEDPLRITEVQSGVPNVRFNISDDRSGGWGDGWEYIRTLNPDELVYVGEAVRVPRSVFSRRQWFFGIGTGTREIDPQIFLSD
ncbi:hypothetical protein CL619_03645 [archaeon]|nr:hypothetical protein [archaeon]|tara:strand:- start:431 stop:1102 length:672 start_codon:yes stop_codon:yes gene_type:complete